MQTIRRGNVLDFVAYGFYCSTFEGLDPQRQAATLSFVADAERLWGVRCAPEFGSHCEHRCSDHSSASMAPASFPEHSAQYATGCMFRR